MSKDFSNNNCDSVFECQLEEMRHNELIKEISELKNEIVSLKKKQSESENVFWTDGKTHLTAALMVSVSIIGSIYYLKNG